MGWRGAAHPTCLVSRCFLRTSCGSGSVGSVSLSTAFSPCGEGAYKYSPRKVRCEELALMSAVCTPRQRDLRCGGVSSPAPSHSSPPLPPPSHLGCRQWDMTSMFSPEIHRLTRSWLRCGVNIEDGIRAGSFRPLRTQDFAFGWRGLGDGLGVLGALASE